MHLIGSNLLHNQHVNCLENARGGASDLAQKRKAGAGTREARFPTSGHPSPPPSSSVLLPKRREKTAELQCRLLPASQQHTIWSASPDCPHPFLNTVMPASRYSFLIYAFPLRIRVLRQQSSFLKEASCCGIYQILDSPQQHL